MIRLTKAKPLDTFKVELTLTNGDVIQRDLKPLLSGPIFDVIRNDLEQFRAVRPEGGTVVWPNGADLCPDVLIWDGLPPLDVSSSAA